MISKIIDGTEQNVAGNGGGGTNDYEELINLPQINGNELTGDQTGGDLGLVDAEEGKGLSTNDYTNEDKAKLDIDTHTVEGNPLSFTTDSAQVAKDAVITIEPIQAGSGDPSPSNVRAISGYDKIEVLSTGRNIWGGEKLVNDILSKVTGSTVDRTNKTIRYDGVYVSEIVLFDNFKPNTQYTILFRTVNNNYLNMKFTYTDGSDSHISEHNNQYTAFVSTEGKSISCIQGLWQDTGEIRYDDFGVFEGIKTTSDFEPYKSSTDLTIQLGQTVYGGTLDLKNGVLMVDRAGVDLGNLNYTYNSDSAYFLSTNLTDIAPASISWRHNNITCSCYKQASDWSDLSGNTGINNIIDADDMQVILRDTRYTDVTSFKTAIAGQTLVYKLATPFTIQLTPHGISLLQGINNVSTSADSIKFTYSDGVLATLEDVKQVGESVNALSDNVQEINNQLAKPTATWLFSSSSNVTYRQKLNEIYAFINSQNYSERGKMKLMIWDSWTYNIYRMQNYGSLSFSCVQTRVASSSWIIYVDGVQLLADSSTMTITKVNADSSVSNSDDSNVTNAGHLELFAL